MLMDLSRRIVEVFYRRREKSEDYIVRLDIEPNPLDYDGGDFVRAYVIRRDRVGEFRLGGPHSWHERSVLTNKGWTCTIQAALVDLAEQVSALEKDPNHQAALLEHARLFQAESDRRAT